MIGSLPGSAGSNCWQALRRGKTSSDFLSFLASVSLTAENRDLGLLC